MGRARSADEVAALREARLSPAMPLALLFSSGAIALVYETLWLRRFTSLFGATAPAAAPTVSATFAGLALGSAWFGARAPRWARPLRVYALLEIGAGAAALAIPALERVYASLAPWFYAHLAEAPGLLLGVKTLQILLALFPTTFLLGGTLPVVTHALDDLRGGGGLRSGGLYAANTLGAVLGALAVPFLLLPALGAAQAYVLAIAGSFVLGAAAWWLDLRGGTPRPPPSFPADVPRPPLDPLRRTRLMLAFTSGIVTLGLEVIWVRMLSQVHQNSIHAFAIVLAVFLAALAGGAALGTALARRTRDAWIPLERAWIGAGLLTLAAPAVFVPLTGGLDYLTSDGRVGYISELALVCAVTFAPATLCAGMVLPILLALSARSSGPASPEVGRLLAINTVGAVLGPLITTFALFRWLGLWGSAAALGLAQQVVPLALRGTHRERRSTLRTVSLLVPAALLAWHVTSLPRAYVDRERDERLVWISEGSHGIASAVRDEHSTRLKFDNFYTLGGSGMPGEARQLGHLPLLVHGAPRRVAFIGLGTGITASAALMQMVDEIVVFELLPEAVEGARTIFADVNLRLLENPRVKLVVDDARSQLRAVERPFDVIIGDLVVPWRRGESSLHTREHFANVKRALAQNGLFCLWLPLFQMSEEEFRIVAATFLDVFPRASVWRSDFRADLPALGLVGRAGDVLLEPRTSDERVRSFAPVLAEENRYLAHPAGLWLHLAGELGAEATWVARTRRNTVDTPWLELLSARVPLSKRQRDPTLFRREPLLSFLEEIRTVSPGGPLDAEHVRWRDLGGELFRASTLDYLGEEEKARTLAFATLEALPREIRESVLAVE